MSETRVKFIAEALPYIQKYTGKIFVIKYGGSALKNQEIAESTIKDLVLLNSVGIKVILVHGGGPEINELLEKLGKEVKFENGLRTTDQETMEVVEMVLHGKVQRRLVSMINAAGAKSLGLSGRDASMVIARRHQDVSEGNMVGEIASVNLELLHQVLQLGLIPVISSIAADEQGVAYNLNADPMCAEIAIGMKANKMILMTDTPGILQDKNNPDSLITELTLIETKKLIDNKTIAGGMIPKAKCCIHAIESGVDETIILNGLNLHSLLLEVFTDKGSGTRILK